MIHVTLDQNMNHSMKLINQNYLSSMQYHMIDSDLIQVWDKALQEAEQKVNFVPIKKENVVALKVSGLLPHKLGCFLILHQFIFVNIFCKKIHSIKIIVG
jgi:hypothetical protein